MDEPTFELAYNELQSEVEAAAERHQQQYESLRMMASPLSYLAQASVTVASSPLLMSPLALAAQPLYRLLSNGLDSLPPFMDLQKQWASTSAADFSASANVAMTSLHLLPPPSPLMVAARFTSETMPYHYTHHSSLLALENEASSLPPAVVPSAKAGEWTTTAGVAPSSSLFINAHAASAHAMLLHSPMQGLMLTSPIAGEHSQMSF